MVEINLVGVCWSLEVGIVRVGGSVAVLGEVQGALLPAAVFGMDVEVLKRNLEACSPKLLKEWLRMGFQTIWAGLCC